MTRGVFIEMVRRQIYNGQPADDATITENLVNVWIEQAIATAARKNYTDSIAIDGIAYSNNSFYTTFKSLAIAQDDLGMWKVTLPHIPFGLGQTEGVSKVIFKDPSTRQLSYPVIILTQNQSCYMLGMREIPNKLLGWTESKYIYVRAPLILYGYTAQVTMVSGGDSTDFDAELNVPADYIPVMIEFIKQQLVFEHAQPVDVQNDGVDSIKTT